MRFIFCVLSLGVLFIGSAQAQNAPIYNAKPSSQSDKNQPSTIYNSSSSRGTMPLFLNRSGKANPSFSSRSRSRSNPKSPYSFGKQEPSRRSVLSLTPDEIRAKQASDKRRAQERMRLEREEHAKKQAMLENGTLDQYKEKFQEDVPKTKPRSVYLERNESSAMPSLLFNSVR